VNARAALRVAALAALLGACGSQPQAAPAEPARRGAPVAFAYGTTTGEELGSASTRGRVTALLFVTTFDISSQLMARRLDQVVSGHRPRANAGAVVLEAPNSAPLVEIFRSTLNLRYPVAIAGATPLDHDGPFGKIDRVPTLVVLDKRGREVERKAGVFDEAEIDALLKSAER
jgi:hypothetical protein